MARPRMSRLGEDSRPKALLAARFRAPLISTANGRVFRFMFLESAIEGNAGNGVAARLRIYDLLI